MSEPISADVDDVRPSETSPLANFAVDAVSKLVCEDFESCRTAARQLSELNFYVSKEMVNRYDPQGPEGFADLINFFASLFADKREAAAQFGVAVSTFYRWKSGEAVPHALVRSSVRDAISNYISDREIANPEILSAGPRLRMSRTRSH